MTTTETAQPAYPIESVGNALGLLLLRERKHLRVSEGASWRPADDLAGPRRR